MCVKGSGVKAASNFTALLAVYLSLANYRNHSVMASSRADSNQVGGINTRSTVMAIERCVRREYR